MQSVIFVLHFWKRLLEEGQRSLGLDFNVPCGWDERRTKAHVCINPICYLESHVTAEVMESIGGSGALTVGERLVWALRDHNHSLLASAGNLGVLHTSKSVVFFTGSTSQLPTSLFSIFLYTCHHRSSVFLHTLMFTYLFFLFLSSGKILFRRSHVRDVAMKRLRFIDDYCRVKRP